VVPARGGSKGVPRKNVAIVAGRPLIEWTIMAARQATCIDQLIVSTDDEEIAAVARAAGADVPFRRPADLSHDDAAGADVVLHALQWIVRHRGYTPEYVVTLQPTSPLRTAGDIDAAIALARVRGAHSVVSVSPAVQSPYWMVRVDEDLEVREFLPGDPPTRQQLPALYAINGAVYVTSPRLLFDMHALYGPGTLAYVMPEERSLDVDTRWEMHVADLVLAARA
jgi:CMP-N-acetylneuraminic acid synthetase